MPSTYRHLHPPGVGESQRQVYTDRVQTPPSPRGVYAYRGSIRYINLGNASLAHLPGDVEVAKTIYVLDVINV